MATDSATCQASRTIVATPAALTEPDAARSTCAWARCLRRSRPVWVPLPPVRKRLDPERGSASEDAQCRIGRQQVPMADVEVGREREGPVDDRRGQQRRRLRRDWPARDTRTRPHRLPPRASAANASRPTIMPGIVVLTAKAYGKYHHQPVIPNCPLRNAARSAANCTVMPEP